MLIGFSTRPIDGNPKIKESEPQGPVVPGISETHSLPWHSLGACLATAEEIGVDFEAASRVGILYSNTTGDS